ncbi:MAG: hypothetical protein LBC02_13740 [Planctomycetaceae bacterium]|jgi:hypothetical protein|nr:hypothetical protein [Planctomycetaceae bacterium]
MKKNFLFCLIAVVVVCSNNLYLFAGTDEQFIPGEGNKYILTVSNGDPASAPNPAVVYNSNPKNDVAVSFKISIEKTLGTGREDISEDVRKTEYSVAINGDKSVFVSCNPLYGNFWRTRTDCTKETEGFYKEVTPVIRSRQSGDKAVTLTVKVTMKDNTELTASEIIEFKIFAFGITVYAKVGNVLTPPNATDNYYSATVSQSGGGGSSGSGTSTGHASFKISTEDGSIPPTIAGLSDYVNKPCGFFPGGGFAGFKNQILSWPGSENQPSPSTIGKLTIPDNTGGTNKEFGITEVKAKSALEKIDNLKTSPPDYVLHSNNCVDVCLKVATAAGLDLGKCQYDVMLRSADGIGERKEKMALPDELEKMLK